MLKIIRVEGESLSPEYLPGDYALLYTGKRGRQPKPGSVIVFRHPAYGVMIKRVQRVDADGWLYVTGSHPHSVDSARFGPIPPQEVIGTVIWHIRRPRPKRSHP